MTVDSHLRGHAKIRISSAMYLALKPTYHMYYMYRSDVPDSCLVATSPHLRLLMYIRASCMAELCGTELKCRVDFVDWVKCEVINVICLACPLVYDTTVQETSIQIVGRSW